MFFNLHLPLICFIFDFQFHFHHVDATSGNKIFEIVLFMQNWNESERIMFLRQS